MGERVGLPYMDVGFPGSSDVLENHGVVFGEEPQEGVEVAHLFGRDGSRLPVTAKAELDGNLHLAVRQDDQA